MSTNTRFAFQCKGLLTDDVKLETHECIVTYMRTASTCGSFNHDAQFLTFTLQFPFLPIWNFCLSAALIWNSKELFSYISLQKMDFFNLANDKLKVCASAMLQCYNAAVPRRLICSLAPCAFSLFSLLFPTDLKSKCYVMDASTCWHDLKARY